MRKLFGGDLSHLRISQNFLCCFLCSFLKSPKFGRSPEFWEQGTALILAPPLCQRKKRRRKNLTRDTWNFGFSHPPLTIPRSPVHESPELGVELLLGLPQPGHGEGGRHEVLHVSFTASVISPSYCLTITLSDL